MNNTVFFGLDGATYTVLDDLVKRGVMPYLGAFMKSGVRGTLRSVKPPLTPPAWTTAITGRSMGHHGVANFLQFEPEPGRLGSVRFISGRHLAADTLWTIANRHGKRAGSLNFVAHNPAPKIDGWVVPGWVGWRWVKRDSHPKGLLTRLQKEIPGLDVKQLAMDFNEEKKAVEGAALDDYDAWIDLHIQRERQLFSILRHQIEHDPCELTAVVFDGVDKLQHLCWQFLDPSMEPAKPSHDFLSVREHCWEYFRQIDGYLKEIVDLCGRDTTVFIVSDHGFTGSNEIFYVNTWLEQQGYLTWKPGASMKGDESSELTSTALLYHLRVFDMDKTTAYAPFASSNGIYIQIRDVTGPGGIDAADYESFREELIDALRTRCVDPQTGEPIVTGVWRREEIGSGPFSGRVPDLTLELRDYGFFSVLKSQSVLKERPMVMGTHHPDGVVIAAGNGIRRGGSVKDADLFDVAPTTLYAMGLPIPPELEGRVLKEAFTVQHLRKRPVRYERGHETGLRVVDSPGRDDADEEMDEQIYERLKALGYME